MRAAAAVILAVALARVAGAVPPPPRPEIEVRCSGPADEAKLRACFARVAPRAKLTQLAPGVVSAAMPDETTYLLVGAGGRWRIAFHQWDKQYEFLHAAPAGPNALRVDVMHHLVLGGAQVLIERMTVVCRADNCETFTTGCTVLDHGRTTGMFRLTLADGPGGFVVTGDKRYAGEQCGGR